MHNRKERVFLGCLCKGHIQDLIDDVGWNDIQKEMIKKRYLEFKSKPRICMELHISGTKYSREQNNLYLKLRSYLIHSINTELTDIYNKLY